MARKSETQFASGSLTSHDVSAVLRAEIIAGSLPANAVLRQEELAERFNTSRMPIRDGLRRLETEGLISIEANKSARVTALAPQGLQEIAEMRCVLEPLALKHALPELTERQIERASAVQQDAENSDLKEFPSLNRRFHELLLEPCGRPRLLRHIAGLNNLSQRFFYVVADELDYADRSHNEHRELLEMCRARDTRRACALLERHIHDACQVMLAALGR